MQLILMSTDVTMYKLSLCNKTFAPFSETEIVRGGTVTAQKMVTIQTVTTWTMTIVTITIWMKRRAKPSC